MNTTPIHELYLAVIVGLSLVLPLLGSAWAPRKSASTKPWLRTIVVGQACLGLGAALVMFSPLHPACGLALALAGCAALVWLLRRQLRPAQTRNA